MAELRPYPFSRLVSRMFAELEQSRAIFDLPARKFVLGDPALDLGVELHGKRAATPLGPAAGPHSQLAQNLVLSFLGGGRIFELKTVQILDRLKIPRPCIDMQTAGYNVEWSQELTLEQSLEEYVKGSMLIEMLVASGALPLSPGFGDFLFDMSVGYDLAGIKTDRVQTFMRGMKDARGVVERLRAEIPDEHRRFRDLDYRTCLSDTLTLSTFHGCPPDEIERMIEWLQEELRLHCIVKLNPTLLGPAEVRRTLHELLGYADRVPDAAFAKDTKWDQATAFVERLGARAAGLGLGFGVKFTNTLIVENRRSFFPSAEKEMYLSGKPLHVLAMSLVGRFREAFGDRFPISFSAGIDKQNFADSVSLGLVPITVCTDLLRTGGYGRMQAYFQNLGERMGAASARTIDDWVLLGQGQAEAALDRVEGVAPETLAACRSALAEKKAAERAPALRPGKKRTPTARAGSSSDLRELAGPALHARWLREARLLNTARYVDALMKDPRYTQAQNEKLPPKIGSRLELFDCITCDKCVPVCPNDANFTYVLPTIEIPVIKLRPRAGGGWDREVGAPLAIKEKHQIATYADFCNECGNCDVFCPEDGGPYVLKPRFFGSHAEWARLPTHDGFFAERDAGADRIHGRFGGKEYALSLASGRAIYAGEGFELTFAEAEPEATMSGSATGEVDLTYFHIMNWLRKAVLDRSTLNYVNA